MTSNPYSPSNGTEGVWFTEKYCMNCKYCDPNPLGKKQCKILAATFFKEIGDPGYPKEWIEDETGPRCTAHEPWDWEKDGEPGETRIVQNNPDQAELFK